MKKVIIIVSFIIAALGSTIGPYAAEVILGPDLKIPPYYKATSGRCDAGRGYNFTAEAPNYPSTYPNMTLKVFNGEVIAFLFEVDPKEGWKPWYDQPEGKPTRHGEGILHYTQTIYMKKGPTAEECKASKGPYEK